MPDPCRVYLISPPAIDLGAFVPSLKRAFEGGDVASFQLRLKGAGDDEVLRAVETLMPICVEHDVALIVNDRPDLAAKSGADGVHIGADDGDYKVARAAVGKDKIVGVSCYDSRHRALVAAEAGADYVAFGAFFPTATKEPRARANFGLLRWWSQLTVVPCVAIGGINAENCGMLVKAGADFLAVISAVWDHPEGPGAGVTALNAAIKEASVA